MLSLPAAYDWRKAHVLCTGAVEGVRTMVVSDDGGTTWRPASKLVADAGDGWRAGVIDGQGSVAGSVYGIPQGYLKNVTPGPWRAMKRWVYSIDDNTINVRSDASVNVTWGATARPVGLLSFSSGGVAYLGGQSYIATPWIWYADEPIVEPGQHCCNGSIVAYITEDDGLTWRFLSEIASKQRMGGFPSEEGPNENDVVMLRDNKTLLCVFRKDGGDGVPHHDHVPYVLATSTDRGQSWVLKEAPSGMLSARPRALVLPNGALVITGGRPALNLWISVDGFGATWQKFDIPTIHNSKMTDPVEKFCPQFENASSSLGWEQSSCYNQLGILSPESGLVCYERQGAASGGTKKPPTECAVPGASIYCMRFSVDSRPSGFLAV